MFVQCLCYRWNNSDILYVFVLLIFFITNVHFYMLTLRGVLHVTNFQKVACLCPQRTMSIYSFPNSRTCFCPHASVKPHNIVLKWQRQTEVLGNTESISSIYIGCFSKTSNTLLLVGYKSIAVCETFQSVVPLRSKIAKAQCCIRIAIKALIHHNSTIFLP